MIDPSSLTAFAEDQPAAADMELDVGANAEPTEDAENRSALRFLPLLRLLQDHAASLETAASECDYDAMSDPDRPMGLEDQALFLECLADLDDGLKAELRELGEIPMETAVEVSEHLLAEEYIADPELFAGFLVRASNIIADLPDEDVGDLPEDYAEDEEIVEDGSGDEELV